MGAVYGHFAFGVSMALFSFFGIGAAAGVVVNDNLVLVDYIERQRKAGVAAMEAVIEAAVVRFRPILLTTVTTFVGLIPIMMERSTDAQFLKPAVLSLAFGVLFALFVTLVLVPALYLVGEDVRQLRKQFSQFVVNQYRQLTGQTA
jgi:multidrug efflux pump subunit AcrB